MRKFIRLSILSMSILSTLAYADPVKRPGYVSVDTALNYIVFKNKTRLKDGFMPSVGVNYNFDGSNSVGLNISWIRSQWKGAYSKSINGGLYLIDYKHHFNLASRYQPFILAGMGYSHFKSPTQSTDLFNLSFGAGMDYTLTKRIFANVTMKDLYTPKSDRHNGVFGVGISYRFLNDSQVAVGSHFAEHKNSPLDRQVMIIK